MFAYCEEIQRRIEWLEQELIWAKNRVKGCPEGELLCAKNESRYKWYLTTEKPGESGKTRSYLPKSEWKLAQRLARKKYDLCYIQELEHEMAACREYLEKAEKGKVTDKLLKQEGYRQLLGNQVCREGCTDMEEKVRNWVLEPYESNEMHPEKLIIGGVRGYCLRSKSEAMIDKALFSYGIPFRYECKLTLGGRTFYPDFTMMHPKTGKLFYWEHFGMMDNPEYVDRACQKLGVYCRNGVIPYVNLILTYETKLYPLGIDTIERAIHHYFS